METTVLTIEYNGGCYYFDLNTNSRRVYVYWYENRLKSFNSLESALIWFINTHSDYKVLNVNELFINL